MSGPPSPLLGFTSGGLHVTPEDLDLIGIGRRTRSNPGNLLPGLGLTEPPRRRTSSTDPNLLLDEDPHVLAPTEPSTLEPLVVRNRFYPPETQDGRRNP